jgi:hypothetical protein
MQSMRGIQDYDKIYRQIHGMITYFQINNPIVFVLSAYLHLKILFEINERIAFGKIFNLSVF